jgi:hypothetical protein
MIYSHKTEESDMTLAPKVAGPRPKDAETRIDGAWRPARLIPTTGMTGVDEQERRATSVLLAVMGAVPDFGRALLAKLDAPAGKIRTFTEIRFHTQDLKVAIPDGGIVVERGKTVWRCLVEVKTGNVPLRIEQVAGYIDLARAHDVQAVLTISNQITSSPSDLPIALDAKRLKKTVVRHLSWWQILTEAIDQHRYRRISDPDQSWILGELIAYLDNEKSGAGGFDDMGDKWVAVRDGARAQALRAGDPGVQDVTARWEQFVQYLALGLRQDLGRDVQPVWPKNVDPPARKDATVKELVETGRLSASLRVPDAVAPIDVQVDLRARLVTTSIVVQAPKDGRPRTRIKWLLRQLKNPPGQLRAEATFPLIKESTSQLVSAAQENPDLLLWGRDPQREPRSFRVALPHEMGAKRGKGPGSFVSDTKKQVADFYREVVQQVKPWAAGAPKLPQPPDPGEPLASPRPPDFTAVEARDPGEGLDPN